MSQPFSITAQLEWLKRQPFTRLRQVRQQPEVADVAGAVARELRKLSVIERIPKGGRVAVAVGSRGIGQLFEITKTAIQTLSQMGFAPFVVAAMGSHGGATSEGQRELLGQYGISAERLGVPVRTEMDVAVLGQNDVGESVYWDKNALAADGVITISRIKAHTDFTSTFESGIVKMLVIGLGKREGAQTHHRYGVRGLRDILPRSLPIVLEKTRFVAGLAIVENAAGQPALIEAVPRERVIEREPQLLAKAKELAGKLPFDALDLLVVGELGKNYSGTGMDVHVLGRHFVEGVPDLWKPSITRICVLDLSPESDGNAVGAGLADLVTDRLIAKTDAAKTRMNYLTSCFLLRAKVPLGFPTDRECIAAGLQTCWQPKLEALRAAVIPNTLELNELWVTPTLALEARERRDLQITGLERPLAFDAQGSLSQAELFPDSWQARRTISGPIHV